MHACILTDRQAWRTRDTSSITALYMTGLTRLSTLVKGTASISVVFSVLCMYVYAYVYTYVCMYVCTQHRTGLTRLSALVKGTASMSVFFPNLSLSRARARSLSLYLKQHRHDSPSTNSTAPFLPSALFRAQVYMSNTHRERHTNSHTHAHTHTHTHTHTRPPFYRQLSARPRPSRPPRNSKP